MAQQYDNDQEGNSTNVQASTGTSSGAVTNLFDHLRQPFGEAQATRRSPANFSNFSGNSSNRSTNNEPTMQSTLRTPSGTTSSSNESARSLPRSNPIAIVKSPADKHHSGDASRKDLLLDFSSDEDDDNDDNEDGDDDSSVVDVERDAVKLEQRRQRLRRAALGDDVVDQMEAISIDESSRNEDSELKNCPSSLPSRLLLRAPLLASVPTNTNDDLLRYHRMNLPPPMVLQEEERCGDTSESGRTRPAHYGSLRDSHLQGRFLDGPSSYRDARTGDIRRIQHRVHFRESQHRQTQDVPSVSIRERIMQSSSKHIQDKQQSMFAELGTTKNISSLSAMFNASSDQNASSKSEPPKITLTDAANSSRNEEQEDQSPLTYQRTFYEEDQFYDQTGFNKNMLSTSLTGLEVLQAGLKVDPIRPAAVSHQYVMEEMEELPRDAAGNNMLLSRSVSDPTPHLRRTTAPTLSSPLIQARVGNSDAACPTIETATSRTAAAEAVSSRYQLHPTMPHVLLPSAATTNTSNVSSASHSFLSSASSSATGATIPFANTSLSLLSSRPNPSSVTNICGQYQQAGFLSSYSSDRNQNNASIRTTSTSLHSPNVPNVLSLTQNSNVSSSSLDQNPDIEATFDMELE